MSATSSDGARTGTDASLQIERQRTDHELLRKRERVEEQADGVLRTARERADEVLLDARERHDRDDLDPAACPREQIDRERAAEDQMIEADRTTADALLDGERDEGRRMLHRFLESERAMTDRNLDGERSRADEAIASRDSLLAVVSHDLRTMLGAISLSADSILRRAPDDASDASIHKSAERISRSVGRMSRLVGDLLDVASIEAGHLAVTLGSHDGVRILGDALDAFRPLAADRGVRFEADLHGAPIMGRFDEQRILQVIANLLSNAIKFSPKHSAISVAVEDLGPSLLLTVRDQGAGIPKEMLEPIFDRFRQIAPTRRVGLGLGLFISKSIVEAHGGRIWAESVVGEGSTFRFTLPGAI